MATSGNDRRQLGQPGPGSSPAHARVWSPLRWRHHRLAVGTLVILAVSATVSGATVAAHPAAGEDVAASAISFGTVASVPSETTTRPHHASTSPSRRAPHSPVAPPSRSAAPSVGRTSLADISALAADGIPVTALDAYRRAAANANPSCALPWPLLAAIGRVESDHGRFAGAVLHSDGISTPPIIGIRLDGSRSVVVRDTDGGRLDGDTTYDHAVGPMQFIPSTWAAYRADGNGDGRDDPFNIYDAAAAAASYLCRAGGDLRTAAGQQRAVWSYNPSTSYLAEVLALEATYAAGAGVVVPVPPAVTKPLPPPALPPVNPAPPPAASPRALAPATTHRATTSPTPSPTTTPPAQPTTSPPPSSAVPVRPRRPRRPRPPVASPRRALRRPRSAPALRRPAPARRQHHPRPRSRSPARRQARHRRRRRRHRIRRRRPTRPRHRRHPARLRRPQARARPLRRRRPARALARRAVAVPGSGDSGLPGGLAVRRPVPHPLRIPDHADVVERHPVLARELPRRVGAPDPAARPFPGGRHEDERRLGDRGAGLEVRLDTGPRRNEVREMFQVRGVSGAQSAGSRLPSKQSHRVLSPLVRP